MLEKWQNLKLIKQSETKVGDIMYKYKVKHEGLVVVKMDGVRYKAAKNHPTLPEILELPKKIEHENLEPIEDRVISKPKKKGE